MAIETITIRNRYQNDSNKGPYLKVILDDDSSVFVWEEHLFPRVPDHGQLTGEVDRSTRYPRLTSVVDTTTGEVSRKPATADDREHRIARQVAIKAAVELLALCPVEQLSSQSSLLPAQAIMFAEKLLHWIESTGLANDIPF